MTSINTGDGIQPTQAPAGHEEKMIALAESGNSLDIKTIDTPSKAVTADTTPEAKPEGEPRPSWLPEKFKSVEEFTKSYTELEKKFLAGEKPAEDKPVDPTDLTIKDAPVEETKTEETKSEDVALEGLLERAGFKYESLQQEFAEHGDFTPESKQKLYKEFGRQTVDDFMAGQRAQGELIRMRIMSSIGGEQNYQSMAPWVARNFTPGQLAAYNAQVSSSDPEVVEAAVQGAYARYTQANGVAPQRTISGNTSGAPQQSDVFRSQAEVTKAMSDPAYKADPAYRQMVEQKLARSDIWGGRTG